MEVKVNDASFEQEVLKSDVPVFVDFWAEWCAPCLMVAPAVEEIAQKYTGRLKVCRVNVDESPNTAVNYRIMSIPTLALFKDGELVDKIIGALPKTHLEKMIDTHL